MKIQSKDEFKAFVAKVEQGAGYKRPKAYGMAILDRGQLTDSVLQASFAQVNFEENFGFAAVMLEAFMQRGVKIDFSQSEFVQIIEKRDIEFALDALSPYLNEDGHKNVELLKHLDENFKGFDSLANAPFMKFNSKTKSVLQRLSELDKASKVGKFAFVAIFEDEQPKSVEAVYLKLYLLSTKKAPLRSLNLNGAFKVLPNVAWSDDKPIELEWLRQNEVWLKINHKYPKIDFVDKFPRFLAHIIPEDNTRVLESSKVRMGAALAGGTTIMPGAAYVNFNAGTTGACMVEGRVSSSVVVGEGTDIGGGASILGVLSGTSGNAIGIGKACLLGANSVTGIPLGDNCIVDAGIAVLEGTKFFISDENKAALSKLNPNFSFDKDIYKGLELANLNGLHFRMNSQTGQMSVSLNKKAIKLNEALH